MSTPSLDGYDQFNQHTVSLDGLDIHYVDEGNGPPVVIVHGSPLSSFSFRRQIAALASRFRVIALDQLGYGQSAKPDAGAAFPEQADAIRRLLDHLEPGDFRLVVHDWGGPAGLAAVADRLNSVAQLVLVNTTLRPEFAPPLYWRGFTGPVSGDLLLVSLNVFAWGLPMMMRAARSADLRQHYRESLQAVGTRRTMLRLERLEGYKPLMLAVEDALELVDTPALIVWGTPDEYFSKRELEYLREVFPDADVREIPGGGHFTMEDAPDELSRVLLEFLA